MQLSTYAKEYEEMQMVSKEEYLASLRRRSSGFSRGVSKYRGVARYERSDPPPDLGFSNEGILTHFRTFAGIITTDDGRRGSVESLEINISTWEPTV